MFFRPRFSGGEFYTGGMMMYCTLIDVRGDYGIVRYDDTGVESEVTLALLPFGADVGDRLVFEDYTFQKV